MKEEISVGNKRPPEFLEMEDFFLIVWKRKRFIGIATLVMTLVVFGLSLILPKHYEVETGVEIGRVIERKISGASLILVAPQHRIHGILGNKQFPRELETLYGLPDKSITEISASFGMGDLEAFLLGVEAKSSELALTATGKILLFLNNLYKEEFAKSKTAIEEQIKNLDAAIQKMSGELQSLKNHMQQLTIKGKRSPEDAVVVLLYSQIAQKEAYLQLLGEKRLNLKRLKTEITPFRFVSPPIKPEMPSRPKVVVNTAISFAASLIIFLVVAFFLEYLEKIRRKEKNS